MVATEDTTWMGALSDEQLESEAASADQCAHRAGRLGMDDAYNAHRRRACQLRHRLKTRRERQLLEEDTVRETELDQTVVYRGYTRLNLKIAFDRVKDPTDWKAAITADLRADQIPLVRAAVEFFTATELRTTRFDPATCRYHVESVGYRMGPAGP